MVTPGVLQGLLTVHKPNDSFYVYDLKLLDQAYSEWTRTFPTITPYYAVKCNPDPEIIRRLANLGACFDCATPAEIKLVTSIGVEKSRIIHANPCKRAEDICGLVTTFDSISELQKIAMESPYGADLILRIRADDPDARCALGNKYGAEEEDWEDLLTVCSRLSLNLVGISFHVGSMAKNASAFVNAIQKSKKAVEAARRFGFDPKIIDIGGGFSSNNIFDLGPVPSMINQALSDNFTSEFKIIAEPGRYFAEHIATLVTPVIGVKKTGVTISESLYGSFNCILFDHATPEFYILNGDEKGPLVPKTMFGSTCDGGDIIFKECLLPKNIAFGHWLVWPRMGAYTSAATTNFNGIPFNNRQKIYLGL